jgi:hypothetical protein
MWVLSSYFLQHMKQYRGYMKFIYLASKFYVMPSVHLWLE